MICCHRRGEHAVFNNCRNHYGTSAQYLKFKMVAKQHFFAHKPARVALITLTLVCLHYVFDVEESDENV